MISVVIFTSNVFLPSLTRTSLSHTHCLCQTFTAPTHTPSQTERSTPTHHNRDLAGHRNCADRRRSRSRRSQSRDRHFARSRSRSSKSARLRSRSRRSTLRAIAIEIGKIAIAISPIEFAPIAISPRKYAVILGFI